MNMTAVVTEQAGEPVEEPLKTENNKELQKTIVPMFETQIKLE